MGLFDRCVQNGIFVYTVLSVFNFDIDSVFEVFFIAHCYPMSLSFIRLFVNKKQTFVVGMCPTRLVTRIRNFFSPNRFRRPIYRYDDLRTLVSGAVDRFAKYPPTRVQFSFRWPAVADRFRIN